MKILKTLILIFSISLLTAKAQDSVNANFQIKIEDGCSNALFQQHPTVKKATFSYSAHNKTAMVTIHHYDDQNEKYNLRFAGDRYLIKRKYPQIVVPKLPGLSFSSLNNIKDFESFGSVYNVLITNIKDSTIYEFRYQAYADKIYDYVELNRNPSLDFDHFDLEKKLTNKYRSWKPIKIADSTIFLKGLVETSGVLSELKLKSGATSLFAEKMIDAIKAEHTLWILPVNGGQRYRSDVSIFIKLNEDDTITFDTQ